MTNPTSSNGVSRIRVLLILFVSLVLGACAQKTIKSQATGAGQAQPTSDTATRAIDSASRLKFEQGIAALSVRDFAAARRSFNELVRANPDLSGPYANLALIDYQQKKYERSFKQINKAIELNPLQAQSYHLRAQIQLQNGEIKQARNDYQKALELDPAYLNAHYNLALLYDIYLQEIALAIEHYSIYLSLLGEKDEIMQDWINHLKGTLENG